MKIKGIRKIIIGFVFLLIGIVMIFKIQDSESKQIFFDYLWKLAGVLVAGNGVEHISEGITKFKRES